MYYLKLGLARLTPPNLVSKSSRIESKMDGNAHFPSPTPTLAEVTAKREELVSLITIADGGEREAIANRNTAYNELGVMLRKLASYVSLMADGKKGVILSSGFEVRKQAEPAAPLTRPEDLSVVRTAYEGKVTLDWAVVKGTQTYVVEMTAQNPEEEAAVWSTIGMTTKSKMDVSDLQFGAYYYFRVKAVGTRNESPFSEVAFIRAA